MLHHHTNKQAKNTNWTARCFQIHLYIYNSRTRVYEKGENNYICKCNHNIPIIFHFLFGFFFKSKVLYIGQLFFCFFSRRTTGCTRICFAGKCVTSFQRQRLYISNIICEYIREWKGKHI